MHLAARTRRRLLPSVTIVALAAVLAACGGGSTGPSSTASGPPVSGGTIVYGADREPICLDPHNNGDMPQTYVARQFLDSLVSERPDGTVVPWLADSWTVSPDGLTYTFKIKQGVKFHDGTPLDAAAVKANFDQMLDPGNAIVDRHRLSEAVLRLIARRRSVDLRDEASNAVLGAAARAGAGVLRHRITQGDGPRSRRQLPVAGRDGTVHRQGVGARPERRTRSQCRLQLRARRCQASGAGLPRTRQLEVPGRRLRSIRGRAGPGCRHHLQPAATTECGAQGRSRTSCFRSSPTLVYRMGSRSTPPASPFTDTAVRQAFIHGANAEAAVKSAYFGVFNWEHGPAHVDDAVPRQRPARVLRARPSQGQPAARRRRLDPARRRRLSGPRTASN